MRNENGEVVDKSRNILEEIADCVRTRIENLKKGVPLELVRREAERMEKGDFLFEKALQEKGMSFICEVKKASPSKGLIAKDFPYMEIAKEYELAGASAISCLTEPQYFQGQDIYLKNISKVVSIPVLRKDFFVDEYMIYEAKMLGASAILLICAILTEEELKHFFAIAEGLGLSSIFEAHDEEEVQMAINCGARIIGVNNRNLKTFELDLQTSVRLRGLVDSEILFISESGIQTREHIELLEAHRVDAVLIGETLMRVEDKKQMLEELNGTIGRTKIKICGLKSLEDIQVANELKLDYIGFVFAESKRQVTKGEAKILKKNLRKQIQAVGIFVDHSVKEIIQLLSEGIIDVVQLHGSETEEDVLELKDFNPSIPVIKAISMTCVEDALKWNDSKVDYLLLDHGAGGTGEAFDWSLLEGLEVLKKPYFIAGGLNPENVADVLAYKPFGVDVSGGVETLGKKDCEKMREFMEKVRT